MHVTVYAVPALGGGFLSIPATQATRRVEIVEDDSDSEQGLVYKLPFDKFNQIYEVEASREPIVLGDDLGNRRGAGSIIGLPIQRDQSGTVTLRPADTLIMVTSANAATKVRVTEYD